MCVCVKQEGGGKKCNTPEEVEVTPKTDSFVSYSWDHTVDFLIYFFFTDFAFSIDCGWYHTCVVMLRAGGHGGQNRA